MPEAYAWPEGSVSIYTGAGATSAVVAYAQNSNLALTRGWMNQVTLGGAYSDHLTGQRADVSLGAVYTFDKTLQKLHESATAVHMKLMHSSINGSAGFILYSGRIDSFQYAGTEENPYTYTLAAHFNAWSAF